MKISDKILAERGAQTEIVFPPQFSEVEMTYKSKAKSETKVSGSKDCYDALWAIWSNKIEYVEEFCILLLNRASMVIAWAKISQGGIAGTYVDRKCIFQIALAANASSIILSHNHPSGNKQPSQSDITETKALVAFGKVLDIEILDHLIMTTEGYYSFLDEGLI